MRKNTENFKSDCRHFENISKLFNLHLGRQVRRIIESEYGQNVPKTGTQSDPNIIVEGLEGKGLSFRFFAYFNNTNTKRFPMHTLIFRGTKQQNV